ncbi:unnamed protein product [Cladocopium goreaui]|uniref:C2H2-type domain-containing protein n=1 Tax=Cladocopium goreaui TaxID=2562237 RepID=A0A9P1FLF7_9DINO|nr:unnamed protein product [Cladocopium goreaui]
MRFSLLIFAVVIFCLQDYSVQEKEAETPEGVSAAQVVSASTRLQSSDQRASLALSLVQEAEQSTDTTMRRTRKKTPKKKQADTAKENYGVPAMDPPWQSTASTAPTPTPAAAATETAESVVLKELVQALESSDNPLSEEVQAVVEKAKKPIEPPPTAKAVRQSWDKLEKKRKQLHQAQVARSNLHRSWAKYIEDSVKRWKSFASDFATKDQALEKKVVEAKEAMQDAREKYDKARDAIDRQDAVTLEAVEDISDGMDEEPTDRIATAEEIQEGIATMVSSLEAIRVRPSEEQPETEQANKKAKLGHQAEAAKSSAFGASALQPFGTTHRVSFNHLVELYVGAELDYDMQRWNHLIQMPVNDAKILRPLERPMMDETSLMATGEFQRDRTPRRFPTQHHRLQDDHRIAQDPNDPHEPSEPSDDEESNNDRAETDGEDNAPDWFASVLFALNFQPQPMRVNWNDYESMHWDAAVALGVSRHHLYTLHHLPFPPLDLADAGVEALIGHRHNDIGHGSNLQLVLMDVEFHSAVPDVQPEVVRRVVRLPRQIGRMAMLQRLGLREYCRTTQHPCMIWHNRDLLSPTSARPLALAHGHYIRVAVPPGGDEVLHIATRCVASACHQGISAAELCDRHALYVLGWYDTIIGPPLVPLPPDEDVTNLMQLSTVVPPEEHCPWFLLRTRQCFIDAWEQPCPFQLKWSKIPAIEFESGEEPQDHLEDEPPYRRSTSPTFERPIGQPANPLQGQPAVIQELFMLWLHVAMTQQGGEDTVIPVETWYLSEPGHVICGVSRTVNLGRDFQSWLGQIIEEWEDVLDRTTTIQLHAVRPMPRATIARPTTRPHIILKQRTPADMVVNLYTVLDSSGATLRASQFATFGPRPQTWYIAIRQTDMHRHCDRPESAIQCMVWHGDFQLRAPMEMDNRDGFEFTVIVNPTPTTRITLHLESLIPETVAVKLIAPIGTHQLPTPLEVAAPGEPHQIAAELVHWGHHCQVHDCCPQDCFLCLPAKDSPSDEHWHYVFCHDDAQDCNGVFCHSAGTDLDEIQLMAFLCDMGYPRAVILAQTVIAQRWKKVLFHHREPELHKKAQPQRTMTPWPARGDAQKTSRCLFMPAPRGEVPMCALKTPFDQHDLDELFASSIDVLCTELSGIELPPEINAQLQAVPVCPLTKTSRLSDDSAACKQKHIKKAVKYCHHFDMHQQILQIAPQDWHRDVEHQTEHITQELHDLLAANQAGECSSSKKPYVNQEIWELRSQKIVLRKKIKAVNYRLRRELLQDCFLLWQKQDQREKNPEIGQQTFNYGVTLRCKSLHFVARLRAVGWRLRHELTRSKSNALQRHLDQLPEDTSAADFLRELKPFTGIWLYAVQVEMQEQSWGGPMPPATRRRQRPDIDGELYDNLIDMITDASAALDLFVSAADLISDRAISWTRLRSTLLFLVDTLTQEDNTILPIDVETIKKTLHSLIEPENWPFLQQDRVECCSDADLTTLEDHCDQARRYLERGALAVVPRPLGRHRVILHLYSGRRRRGDVQFYLDKLASSQAHFMLHIVSLDIVIDPVYGDAMRADTYDFWLTSIRSGYIIAMLAGPPCESWSRARGVSLHGKPELPGLVQRCGPRIIRDIQHLWGLESVTIRELEQLQVGNALLGFTLLALLEMALADGHGMVEHPAEPEDLPHAASIWRLPLVKAIMQLPNIELLRFSQGLMGAKSHKPTHLLLLNLPQLLTCLHANRVRCDIPRAATIGKDQSGNWNTAVLKEYPPAMCRAVAHALFQATSDRPVIEGAPEPPAVFIDTCKRMHVTAYGESIGADYVQR